MAVNAIKDRLVRLIVQGESLLTTKRETPHGAQSVERGMFFNWQAAALSFLSHVFGEEHIHFREFHKRCRSESYVHAQIGQAILKAAMQDIEEGYLKHLESLVSADIFVDFLDMAEYLLEQGYKDPAASLIGAVLEDGLRRIVKNRDITLKTRENIVSLNQKLADNKVYNRMFQEMVQVWNTIRDNADHGNFQEYTSENVKDMLKGIRAFLTSYV